MLVGGANATGAFDDVWSTADGKTWLKLASNVPFGARTGHSVFVSSDGARLYVAGGRQYISGPAGEFTVVRNDVWSSSDAINWRNETLAAAWGPRYGHSGASINGNLYIMAGLLPAPAHDVWVSTDGGKAWAKAGSGIAGWTPRAFASIAAWQNTMYLFGGTDLQQPLVDFFMSADGIAWKQVTGAVLSPPGRTQAPMLPFGGRLWLFPGTEGPAGGIWWTTRAGQPWSQVSSGDVFGQVTGYGVAALQGSLVAVGGYLRDR